MCNRCGKEFKDGRFRQLDGQPYDDKCYAIVAALKCDKCGKEIGGACACVAHCSFLCLS